MLVGYARVSTSDHNVENQITLLKEQGCDHVYWDVASGVKDDRKGLQEMVSFLREGVVVLVYNTDRIFRSLKNMILYNIKTPQLCSIFTVPVFTEEVKPD